MCDIVGIEGGLQALSALANLQELHLCGGRVLQGPGSEPDSLEQQGRLLECALQHLVKLTNLHLGDASADAGRPFMHLSCLHQLQHLELSLSPSTAATLQVLPASLTALAMTAVDTASSSWQVSSSTAPGLCQLTDLKRLIVSDNSWNDSRFSLSAAVLTHMQQLQHLEVRCEDQQFMPQFLEVAAPVLKQLQHLNLRLRLPLEMADNVHNCSALATLTQLTYMRVESQSGWPAGSLEHMFSATFPALKGLTLNMRHLPPGRSVLDIAGLQHLVTSCPGLQELNLDGALPHYTEVGCLRQLTALTSLTLGGPAVTDRALREELCRMVHLRELMLGDVDAVAGLSTPAGLMCLTQLTRLTCLSATTTGDEWCEWLEEGNYCQILLTCSDPQVEPVVWRLLTQLLEGVPAYTPDRADHSLDQYHSWPYDPF